jgi:hypothetical protein
MKTIMKKIKYYVALAGFLFATSSINAQAVIDPSEDAATTKGDVLLDIGIGLIGGDYNGYDPGNYGATYWNYSNSRNRVQLPTLSIALQKAFWNDVTIGGQVAFNIFGSEHDLRQSDGYYQHSDYTQSNTFIMARGEYHFGRLINWPRYADLYAGVLAGTRITTSAETNIYEGWGNGQPGTWRNDYPNRTSTNVGPAGGLFGGIRYYFTKKTAVYIEAGLGITNIRTGLAWRF